MAAINTDAFGREVNVGDYVAFTTKGGPSGGMSLGLVVKFTKNRVILHSINTWGRTVQDYLESKKETEKTRQKNYAMWEAEERATGKAMEPWRKRFKDPLPLYDKTTLHSLTSATLIEPIGLPPGVQQILKV